MRYGALIGDIAGSRFEGVSNEFFKSERHSLLRPEDEWYKAENAYHLDDLTLRGFFTDDSILTLAVAEAILKHRKTGEDLERLVIQQFQEKGRAFAHRGFGSAFSSWMYHAEPRPYGSYGNGAAMRVSPCAWLAKTYSQAIEYTHIVTSVTHNHPDSIWGAEVVTSAIWLLRELHEKDAVAKFLRKKYDLDLDAVRNSNFQINCKQAVSLAFKAFMDADGFNETLHNAICYGGDTDTLGAIAGSIAEAMYPIDPALIVQAEKFFSEEGASEDWDEPVALEFCKAFTEWEEPKHKRYSSLIKHLLFW